MGWRGGWDGGVGGKEGWVGRRGGWEAEGGLHLFTVSSVRDRYRHNP